MNYFLMDIFSTFIFKFDCPWFIIKNGIDNTTQVSHPETFAPCWEGIFVMLECVPHQKTLQAIINS